MSDPPASDPIAKWRDGDGRLYNLSPWVDWNPSSRPTHGGGELSVGLDGDFTAAELRAIADTMEQLQRETYAMPPPNLTSQQAAISAKIDQLKALQAAHPNEDEKARIDEEIRELQAQRDSLVQQPGP